MTTIDNIKSMTGEEVSALNKDLSRKLLKRIALTAVVVVGVHVAASLLAKKLQTVNED